MGAEPMDCAQSSRVGHHAAYPAEPRAASRVACLVAACPVASLVGFREASSQPKLP